MSSGFNKMFSLFLILSLLGLLIFTAFASFASESNRAKLDPILRSLMVRNERYLQRTGNKLNLAPYAPNIAVYSDRQPVNMNKTRFEDYPELEEPNYRYEVAEDAEGYKVGILVETDSPSILKSQGIWVGSTAGDVVTARASLSQIEKLSRSSGVDYVEASRQVEPELNVSVPAIGANDVHSYKPPLEGKSVIIGDVDSGIDYDHKDFRVERVSGDGIDEETSRILRIWDQTNGYEHPVLFDYGSEYTQGQIEADISAGYGPAKGNVNEVDVGGHGTHVMGIAAGDGSSMDPPKYVGVAPESNIIMVKTTWYSADIVDGVNYIFHKADTLGYPAVVNLSLGNNWGPHDGSSLFARAMNELSGPGKIVVASAGNSGRSFNHGADTLEPGTKSILRFDVIKDTERRKDRAPINLWYPSESEFTVTVETPSTGASPDTYSLTVAHGENKVLDTPDGRIEIWNAPNWPEPSTADNEVVVWLLGSDFEQSDTDLAYGTWDLRISAPLGTPGGRYDAWYTSQWREEGFYPSSGGNNNMTIATPATAEKVIAVGAWLTKARWTGADGSTHGYGHVDSSDTGNIAPFSSRGPTRDGRQKPDVTAPGMGVASALAGNYKSYLLENDPDYYDTVVTTDEKHYISQGTSMSAPHVSGQVALMLHRDPSMRPSEVEAALTGSANSDSFTSVGWDVPEGSFSRDAGPTPNYTWGCGKLDSPGAVSDIGLKYFQDFNAGWNLISPPGVPRNPDPGVSLADDVDPLSLYYDYSNGDYTTYPGTFTRLRWKKGYWVHLDAKSKLDMNVDVPTQDKTIQFEKEGWHLFGIPYPVDWQETSFSNITDFQTDGAGHVRLVSWEPVDGIYLNHYSDTSHILSHWRGYWVKVKDASSTEPASITVTKSSEPPAAPGSRTPLPQSVTRNKLDYPPLPQVKVDQIHAEAYPNPVINQNKLTFASSNPEVERVKVTVTNSAGQTIYDSQYQEGKDLTWNLEDNSSEAVPNGLYLYWLQAKNSDGDTLSSSINKLLVLK